MRLRGFSSPFSRGLLLAAALVIISSARANHSASQQHQNQQHQHPYPPPQWSHSHSYPSAGESLSYPGSMQPMQPYLTKTQPYTPIMYPSVDSGFYFPSAPRQPPRMQPYPSGAAWGTQQVNHQIGSQVRKQLDDVQQRHQQWMQTHSSQMPSPPNPTQQAKKQQPVARQPSDWQSRPLTEKLGSRFLRNMYKFADDKKGQAPALPEGQPGPKPFHQGLARVAIAQTNQDFAFPQDPTVLENVEALFKASTKRNSTLKGQVDDRINAIENEVKEPSKCVWAIVSCCLPQTEKVRYSCFELMGCPGAFWDISPCQEALAMAALQHAAKFYKRGSSSNQSPH